MGIAHACRTCGMTYDKESEAAACERSHTAKNMDMKVVIITGILEKKPHYASGGTSMIIGPYSTVYVFDSQKEADAWARDNGNGDFMTDAVKK